MDAGFENLHIFYAKRRFFFDFWTPLVFGPEARIFFFGISLKFFSEGPLGPPIVLRRRSARPLAAL